MTQKYMARSPAIAWRRLDDEVIVMRAKDSTLLTLNDTAGLLFESADGRTPLDEIVRDRICREFDVDFETALADACAVSEELAREGIVTVLGQPAPPEMPNSGEN